LAAVAIGYVADRVDINTALVVVGATSAALSLISLIRFKDVRALD
jgi:multisubunit Na+/H+ antiporter MnhG subunit